MKDRDQILFGIRAVMEALDAGKELERVLLKRGPGSEIFQDLLKKLRMHEVPVQQVPIEKLNTITRKNHQGVIAYISEISYARLDTLLPGIFESGDDPMILLLDRISDVRNFGAVSRTAECAGVHAIVIPKSGAARINAEAVKTSAGALHRIPVCRFERLEEAVKILLNSGLQVYAASEKAERSIYAQDLSGPAAFIMGSEDQGVSPGLIRMATHLVSIPMKGTIASLNVSVAAGVLLFEALRQRTGSIQGATGG